MRILLWHGYLLGGTGSNVYTRAARARVEHASGTTSPSSARSRTPSCYDLGGAAVGPAGRRRAAAGVRPRPLRGLRGASSSRTAPASELERWVEANAAALARRHCRPTSSSATTCCSAAPSERRAGRRYAVKAHGSELEYSMRGQRGASAWGQEVARAARRRRSSARRTSASVLRGGVRPRRPRARGSARRRRRRVAARAARRRARGADRGGAARPAESRQRDERLPDEGNAGAPRSVPRRRRPDRRLLRQADPATRASTCCSTRCAGLDARVVVVGFGDYRAELERQARGSRRDALFTGPLEHRHLVHLLALADACVVPSIFPEAFGMVAAEAAAAGCPPLVARHSGLAEVAAGLEEAYPGAPPPPRVVRDG